MSRTKRKDYYVDKRGEPLFGEKWKATSDKKKWYKPTKKYKDHGYIHKSRNDRREDMKNAMNHPDEDGQIILPSPKRTDTWNWN